MLFGFLYALLFLTISWRYVVYPLFISPLRKVPKAHWTSAISPVWILWKRYAKAELSTVMEAHRLHGSIVQLGPRDISISTYKDGVRIAYGGGFDKPEYYNLFKYYGSVHPLFSPEKRMHTNRHYREQNAFCCLEKKDHSQRRRRISSVYTKTAVINCQTLKRGTEFILMDGLVPRLKHHAKTSHGCDALHLSYALSLNLVNSFIFGAGGSKFMEDDTALQQFLEQYEQKYCDETFWPQELPKFIRFISKLGFNLLPGLSTAATKWLEDWMQQMCDKAEELCIKGDESLPVVYGKVRECINLESKHRTREQRQREIGSELFDHMCEFFPCMWLVRS